MSLDNVDRCRHNEAMTTTPWPQNRSNEELIADIETCERPLSGVTHVDQMWIGVRSKLNAEIQRRGSR